MQINGGAGGVDGGQVTLTSGVGSTDDSGTVIIATADSGSAGVSGDMALRTGTSDAGNTGSFTLTTGAATGGAGGAISLAVGVGDTGNGGQLHLAAGSTSSTSGVGGAVYIRGGNSTSASGSYGGSVHIILEPVLLVMEKFTSTRDQSFLSLMLLAQHPSPPLSV